LGGRAAPDSEGGDVSAPVHAHPGAAVAALLSLEGKVALVAGGGGAIGSAIVRLFRGAGADVVSADLEAQAGDRDSVACDLADPAAIRTTVDGVVDSRGRLDVLVHAAGITRDAVLWKMSDEDWSDVLRVNLDSAFHLLRAAAPRLRERGGAVIFVASINGERGKRGQANYAASKAGMIALAKTAARELGRFGVRVNSIAPGFIDTPMTRGLPADVAEKALEETVLGRIGRPEDVAGAALFLASDLSAHVTGQVLRVDGGQCTA
jgi:NAD(P)-dependent dehydrogenase (short-subunit alcohol dehydrogenase family)